MAGNRQKHSASGPALGYVHQCLWALVELGRRAPDDPAVQLRLEALDDVQFEHDGTPVELLQTKHHIGNAAPLTLQSVDLWRTLNAWMDAKTATPVILRLVTTQALQDGSPLAELRAANQSRDEAGALEALCEAASAGDNKATAAWRRKFLELDATDRELLISRIAIEDSSASARQLDQELARTFRIAMPRGKELVFLQLLQGWWVRIAVRLLSAEIHSVSGEDLLATVEDIVDQLRLDNLPIHPDVLVEIDESITSTYSDREFVQQLLWIAFDKTRLWKAIRDYHRSYTLRSYWLRNQLVAETEIDRFAFSLHDEWEQIFDAKIAAMTRSGRTDAEIVGQEVLEELVRESRARLRDRFSEQWFSRGTLHALADGELGSRIGWHPDFEKRLEDLLKHAS